MKRHKDSDDTTTSSKMKRRRLIMDKTTTTTTTTTTTSTAAADEYWGVLGEDFQWYDRLDLWSSTRQILGQTAHLGYFRDAENASKVTTEVNRRLLHWSYEMLLTARYQLFDAHNHFARNHGGIVVGTWCSSWCSMISSHFQRHLLGCQKYSKIQLTLSHIPLNI